MIVSLLFDRYKDSEVSSSSRASSVYLSLCSCTLNFENSSKLIRKNMRNKLVGIQRKLVSNTSSVWNRELSSMYDSPPFMPTGFIPAVVESTPRYERVMDIYSRLLRERIICVHGPINDELSSVVTSQLLFLESEDPGRPLFMYINSPGGVVTAGLAIYDTMQYIRCPITTLCVGQAASMGSLLLAGGSPGQRYALPNSKIMLHQPSGGVQGMASDIQIQAQEIQRTKNRLNLLYQFHTGADIKVIEQAMDRDTYFTAQDAKSFGVIDEVIATREGSTKTTADLRSISNTLTGNLGGTKLV